MARCGDDCFREAIRLVPGLKGSSHQRFVGGKPGFQRSDSLRLDLVPWEWELSFLASGFEPWSDTVLVESPTAVSPKLVPLPGQIVESDSRGRTLVEVRRSHGADP